MFHLSSQTQRSLAYSEIQKNTVLLFQCFQRGLYIKYSRTANNNDLNAVKAPTDDFSTDEEFQDDGYLAQTLRITDMRMTLSFVEDDKLEEKKGEQSRVSKTDSRAIYGPIEYLRAEVEKPVGHQSKCLSKQALD